MPRRNSKTLSSSKKSLNKYELRPRTSMGGAFSESIKQGFGFGAGSAVAHNAIGSLFNNGRRENEQYSQEEPQKIANPCKEEYLTVKQCFMNSTFNKMYQCDEELARLQVCMES